MLSATRIVEIEPWEYMVLLLYVVFIGFVFSRRKNLEVRLNPEFRYYVWALYAKILGGVAFTLTYIYYYGNGDTLSYFNSSVILSRMALSDTGNWLHALFSDNTMENYYRLFDNRTGYPMEYVYLDDHAYALVKFTSLLALFGFNSILLTVAMVSTLAYGGIWGFYRTLARYYPSLRGQLAFAVLFFPSVVFWGGGIMKDTFTFTGLCWFITAMDRIFFLKRNVASSWLLLLLASYVMIAMKPYVFMMIVPAGLLWVLYYRVKRMRNVFLRLFLLPVGVLVVVGLAFFILTKLEGSLGKYSLGKALDTIMLTQADMKRSEQYGHNYFDLGEVDHTWGSVFSKFPQAVFAGLYRPTLADANNAVMVLTALENTFLLVLSLYILIRSRILFLFTLLLKNPLLQMFLLFSISYAFMIAITTPNFGAMVRFKIPLLPMFVSALFIAKLILDRRLAAIRGGRPFHFEAYEHGEPRSAPTKPQGRPAHTAAIRH
ncbi:MAG: hypothetical protein IT230_13180 [Flavobacteriales bacterium]|nr:hypothetical protein [Flavobacteriales bacterium]